MSTVPLFSGSPGSRDIVLSSVCMYTFTCRQVGTHLHDSQLQNGVQWATLGLQARLDRQRVAQHGNRKKKKKRSLTTGDLFSPLAFTGEAEEASPGVRMCLFELRRASNQADT